MCKCNKMANVNPMNTTSKAAVSVTVNVTNIVKYVSLAGVAIVGIIFGAKCYTEYARLKEKEEE